MQVSDRQGKTGTGLSLSQSRVGGSAASGSYRESCCPPVSHLLPSDSTSLISSSELSLSLAPLTNPKIVESSLFPLPFLCCFRLRLRALLATFLEAYAHLIFSLSKRLSACVLSRSALLEGGRAASAQLLRLNSFTPHFTHSSSNLTCSPLHSSLSTSLHFLTISRI